MFRTKSCANWRGTIYEYEKKTHNSCLICINCKGEYCQIQKVDIGSIGPSFYKYCSHYVSNVGKNVTKAANVLKHEETPVSGKKALDGRGSKTSRMTKNEAEWRQKKSITIIDGRYFEKVSINKSSGSHKACNSIFKSMVLKRLADNVKINVKFVDRISDYTNRTNTLEVTRVSYLGKSLLKAKIGSTVEVNGCRCIVEKIR